ncbi:MAG TPA: hypothetical protein VG248_17325 [Caulobacteraceae bacterium]|jgi:hypothetical protein|nr:hypothetical protein [Caulobacteraceae bacterium]
MKPSDLHVITVHSNPVRYESRRRLHLEHQARMAEVGVTLWVGEAVFGDRQPEVTDPDNSRHIVFRCDSEVWLKEAIQNAVVERMPADIRFLMWEDADVEHLSKDWASETLEALQHYKVVQPFSHVVDLGPDGEVIENHTAFVYQYEKGNRPGREYSPFMHPGYGWAWRRKAWDQAGGMISRAICGAGDHHMALGLIGQAEKSLPGGIHPNYRKMVLDWQDHARRAVDGDIGHIPGTLLHTFHGWKADRRYQSRWSILVDNHYDPEVDVQLDSQGMLRLTGNKPQLRDDLRRYFRVRMEDGGRKSWPV